MIDISYGPYHLADIIGPYHIMYIIWSMPIIRSISYACYQVLNARRSVSESIIFNEQLKSFNLFCNSDDSFDFNFQLNSLTRK